MLTRAHLKIKGRVQRVAFRYFTRDQARRLGLTGFVRNLRDGTVETIFEGEEVKVEEMVQWCHEGPVSARVDEVVVKRGPATGEYQRFEIIS
ncbi:MAG: acylphosphatase [Deltaproteobacteria bacterium]|nr:acylphosphatase [Deltaproteobacteria bacterium]